MWLLKPSGRFQVGCQDVKYLQPGSKSIAADNHVVGRLFYPARATSLVTRVLSPPLTWIRDWHYAKGYVSWGFRNPSSTKERAIKAAAHNTVYALGLTRLLNATYNAAPEERQGAFPVIVFSHGIICSEFASRGFVVAAVEHADGTACCTELANGEWKLLEGLGTGAVLESKCDYRVEECLTMARVLTSMNSGADIAGLQLSGPAEPPAAFRGLLDMDRLSVMGHSCGGATAAAAAAAHAEFKAAVAFDPWWGLLPSASPALHGWQTRTPMLVLGSQDWNVSDWNHARQNEVWAAVRPKPAPASSSVDASRPIARGVPVAAASTAAGSDGSSSSSVGGGAVFVVPAGSGHASFCDLPFLINPWVSAQLRKLAGGKPAAPGEKKVDAGTIQEVINWCSRTFLNDHLPLPADNPASFDAHRRWEARGGGQQQQHSAQSPAGDAGHSATAAAAAAGAADGGLAAFDRSESLVDHLAADETLIQADERAGHTADGAAGSVPSAPRAHSSSHDAALDKASDAQMAAAAAATHVPVKQPELDVYKLHLGHTAWKVDVIA